MMEQSEKEPQISLRFIQAMAGTVPTSQYVIEVDGKQVGMAQLRPTPSKTEGMPEGFESHILYDINPLYQKEGYAAGALRLLLQEAKLLQIQNIILTTTYENVGTQLAIEKNGGILMKTDQGADGKFYRKYSIRT